jgi:hypothetical protein
MSKSITPVIGEVLYDGLAELCSVAREQAAKRKNFHAAALYVVLEALRVQAEHARTAVAVYIPPRKP